MGLFDKKYCDICGKEIKLLGNRKLDDGNMCKDCASKLSPWFSGRRHTSVAAIKEQLDYREKNAEALKLFNPTKIIGKRCKVYIDENRKQFVVTSASNWRNVNPDIISFDDVKGVDVKIEEDRDEILYKDAEGKEISYDPPKYDYEYTYKVHFDVNNPFFDDIDFELTSDKPEDPNGPVYQDYLQMAKDICRIICGKVFNDDRSAFKFNYDSGTSDSEWYCPKCGAKNTGNFCVKCGTARPASFTEFCCSKCGEKITDPGTVFCPKCGNKVG